MAAPTVVPREAPSLSRLSLLVLCLALSCCLGRGEESTVRVITTENFDDVSQGDWMLEFYAPWCPACKQFAKTWESFAEWAAAEKNGLRVGKVDVTTESALSGQFMVTHLPSIFHIHEGEVRGYSKSRTLEDLQLYVEEEEWKKKPALPWWRSPTAKHMKALGVTYWISQKGKELQTMLEKEYELPTYTVYVIIAVATIVVGLLLGGITVCFIEICIRMCSRKEATKKLPRKQEGPKPSPPPEQVGGASESSEQTDEPGEVPVSSKTAAGVVAESPNADKEKKTRKRKRNKAKQES
jgi:thiol-disulfide isomerase/thioredoxin